MDAYIQKPPDEQRLLCEQAQAALGLPAASIEKDLWVCWAMRMLFALPNWGTHLTLKGGTSLSKAWKITSRFSEDIDVVVDRDFLGFTGEDLSTNRRKKLLKTCSRRLLEELAPAFERALRNALPTDAQWSLAPASTEEDKDQQTILFHYPTAFQGLLGYVRPVVKLEFGARSDTEPSALAPIESYLAEAFPQAIVSGAFQARTVTARRTFWEKAMLLHEESFRPPDRSRRARLSRHYYDLWCLIGRGIGQEALVDPGLFDRVANHRARFFEVSWVDYSSLKPGSLRLVPARTQLAYWQEDYRAMRESMFFGEVPALDEIFRVVGEFESRFNSGLMPPENLPVSAAPL